MKRRLIVAPLLASSSWQVSSSMALREEICDLVRWMTQIKKDFVAPPRYQGCYISSCREFYAEFNAKCWQSGNLCRKFVNMILQGEGMAKIPNQRN